MTEPTDIITHEYVIHIAPALQAALSWDLLERLNRLVLRPIRAEHQRRGGTSRLVRTSQGAVLTMTGQMDDLLDAMPVLQSTSKLTALLATMDVTRPASVAQAHGFATLGDWIAAKIDEYAVLVESMSQQETTP